MAASTGPLRVLVVEDSPDLGRLLAMLLQHWGYHFCICTSGKDALATAPEFKPNVVLIAIGLPDMDGWEVARRLPSGPLLVAVTSRSEEDDFRRSLEAGITYHLIKPAFQAPLRELLERYSTSSA
jgi:CheY-like chemotaxis protein